MIYKSIIITIIIIIVQNIIKPGGQMSSFLAGIMVNLPAVDVRISAMQNIVLIVLQSQEQSFYYPL